MVRCNRCGAPTIIKTSWTPYNPGRRFYCCGKSVSSHGIIDWYDPPMCARATQIILDPLTAPQPAGSSKGNGVRMLFDHFGVTPNEVMAIGDGKNDIEMIELASLGITLSNGSEKTKTIVNVIGISNDEDGVADAMYSGLDTTKHKKRLMDIIDAADAIGQAEVAREAIKRLAAAGAVKGALHGKELHCLALRLANHGELTRLGDW
ncbi:haloacid dehalogenase-like hydrolase family protein [Artemisia annua]|uniref:Haloacid dehalogenase-like hydrolase family protein n=1 Tax=Artemisia annua TaxID=35608 RepID=A0A2U1QAI1_ARTAN|nr:haloacid dehalogenase-like hydrolase family protein [Artemisia annua]